MEKLIQIYFFKHFFNYRNASCKCIMSYFMLFMSMLYLITSFVYTVQLHMLRPFAIDAMLRSFTYK